MERFDYEEKQGRRFQPVNDRYNRYSEDDGRYGREERFGRDDDYDYNRGSRRARYARDSDIDRSWSSSSPSSYGRNSGERFSSQDRYENSPNRYDTRDSQRAYNEYDQNFDSSVGSYSRGNEWDGDRGSSYQGSNRPMSSGYNQSYGSQQGQYGSNQGLYGNQRYQSSYGQGYSQGSNQNTYGMGSRYNPGTSSGYSSGSNQSYRPSSGSDWQFNQGSGQSWGRDSSQSKVGRGPKGYKRSDERIKEDISDLLTSHPEVDPSEVEIKVSNCEVTLTGTVDSRNDKRLIEDLASSISGVTDVTNNLRVMQQSGSSSRSSQDQMSTKGSGSSSQTSGSQSVGSQSSSKSIQ